MDNYENLDVIGQGSFGLIRKVRRKSDGRILVRKEIDYSKMSEKEKKQLVSEVNILRELRHPNIVRYYERFVDRPGSRIFIVMEWCEGGDLAGIIKQCKKENKRIPEDVVWNLLTQLLLALQECHHGGTSFNSSSGDGKTTTTSHPTILHRDIKPDNVFLDGAQNVKLGDFGLSRIIANPDVDFAKTFVGTPFYMSPELVSETSYNTKSDIWALGCLIYELCALEPPFQAKTQAGLTQKIQQGRIDPLPSQYSSELMATIKAMLNVNYMKRPSTTEFLKLHRIRMCIKERALLADIKKREDDVKRREAAVEVREAQVLAREEEVRRMVKELEMERNRLGVSLSSVSSMGPGLVNTNAEDVLSLSGLSIGSNRPVMTPEIVNDNNPFTVNSDNQTRMLGPSKSLDVLIPAQQQQPTPISSSAPVSGRSSASSDTSTGKPFAKAYNPSILSNKPAFTSLPRATTTASSTATSSPSPFRRGIQLRTQQNAAVYGGGNNHLKQPTHLVNNENRAPHHGLGNGGFEKAAMRAIGGNVFRSGMTPRKEGV
ncbi:G2-specific serine/threonine protein kinase, partial [Rhizoclosmatium hyalinum]